MNGSGDSSNSNSNAPFDGKASKEDIFLLWNSLTLSQFESRDTNTICWTLLLPYGQDLNEIRKKLLRDINKNDAFKKNAMQWAFKQLDVNMIVPSTGLALFVRVNMKLRDNNERDISRIWAPIPTKFQIAVLTDIWDTSFHPELLFNENVNLTSSCNNFGIVIIGNGSITVGLWISQRHEAEFIKYSIISDANTEKEKLKNFCYKYFTTTCEDNLRHPIIIGTIFGVTDEIEVPDRLSNLLSDNLSILPSIVVNVNQTGLQGIKAIFHATSNFRNKITRDAFPRLNVHDASPIHDLLKNWGIGSAEETVISVNGIITKRIILIFPNMKKIAELKKVAKSKNQVSK